MRGRSENQRRGGTSPLVVMLLAGILIALVCLVAVLATQGRPPAASPGSSRDRPVAAVPVSVADGQTVHRIELSDPPPKPKPVGDPNRIKETLQEGKAYHAVVKFGLQTRAEDRDWGFKQMIALVHAAALVVDRTIEVNDGHRIVEWNRVPVG